MDLNDLPDEVLCSIFDQLDVHELKLASLVCRRWSVLTFSGCRMNRVWLVPPELKHWNEFLINSKRSYRNVLLTYCWSDDEWNRHESLVRFLHTIKPHIRMLVIETGMSSQQLRSVLLEAPELQRLSIGYNSDQKYCGTWAPFRLLPELKSPNRRQLFSFFRANIPNLQFLKMNCRTDVELDSWKLLSGQLKLARVECLDGKYLHSVLELTFPLVEDFSLGLISWTFHNRNQEMLPRLGGAFFRRHPFLRRLSISGMNIPVEWVESISQYCPELTHLELRLNDPNEGFLEPLVQLAQLEHLSLEGKVERKVLRGVMTSLESVELKLNPHRVLLENLFEVVPQLSCLQIKERTPCVKFQFICERFSSLRRLELDFDYGSSPADDSVRLDRLVHLQELKMSDTIRIRWIHRNNVRCLTITRYSNEYNLMQNMNEDELYEIPEKFPLLKKLTIESRHWWGGWLSMAAVERLQKLIPSCRIDRYGQRLHPTADVTAN